jgi:hypothetical protein
MRYLHTDSQFRRALFSHQDADGYVETLLELARQPGARRAELSFSSAPSTRERREAALRARSFH